MLIGGGHRLPGSPTEDLELVERAQAGNKPAADKLLERYRPQIRSYLSRKIRDQRYVEDLTQETLLSAYQSIHDFRRDGPFSAWIYKIALRKALNHVRRVVPVDSQIRPLDETVEKDLQALSQHDPSRCPYNQIEREIIVKRLFAAMDAARCTEIEKRVYTDVTRGLNYAHISATYGVNKATARKHYERGRGKLFGYLVQYEPDLLGGNEAILFAWQRACEAPDPNDRPNDAERKAWQEPRGRVMEFRGAVRKLIQFLPAIWTAILICLPRMHR